MAIYQFLIAVRAGGPNTAATMLTNAEGETTSHVQGMFNRTIRFMTEGIRPVFVFDGKPPPVQVRRAVKAEGEAREGGEGAQICQGGRERWGAGEAFEEIGARGHKGKRGLHPTSDADGRSCHTCAVWGRGPSGWTGSEGCGFCGGDGGYGRPNFPNSNPVSLSEWKSL